MGKILKSVKLQSLLFTLVFCFLCIYVFALTTNADMHMNTSPHLKTFFMSRQSMHSNAFELRMFLGINVLMDRNAKDKVSIPEINNRGKNIWGRDQ